MPSWIAVCGDDEIELEDVVPFVHEGVEYAVYRSPDNQYFATAGHCTHEAQLLCDGLVMGDIIECPKHNGRFDYRTGAARGAPAIVALRTFPARVDRGTVYIEVP
jgi:3-phenylpropionate/trans-cinnamate dioxygenase ferredoxin subunit